MSQPTGKLKFAYKKYQQRRTMENLKRLREIREELGISQEELAKRLGLSVNSVSKYESKPSEDLLKKANKLLDGLK